MKVFEFDPTTGKRGDCIDNVKVIEWTAESVEFAVNNDKIDPIECVMPVDNHRTEHTLHIDAGIGIGSTHKSYRHATEWRTFCMGESMVGHGKGVWCWIVLPPTDLIKRREPA